MRKQRKENRIPDTSREGWAWRGGQRKPRWGRIFWGMAAKESRQR